MLKSKKKIILDALECGLENSEELYNQHLQKFGTSTEKNKKIEEIIKNDIKKIKASIKLLSLLLDIKMDNSKQLKKISAKLLGHKFSLLSDNIDDYPKSFPKWVLKEIECFNDRLRKIAIKISEISKIV